MAQTGFTPILIYASGTTTNTPSAGNLTNSANGAELAINYYDGKLFYKDASNVVQVLATKGSAVVGGSNTQVQYNSSGSLAGSANFVFDGTNVGIGTSSPALKLDVAFSSAGDGIRAYNTLSTGFADVRIGNNSNNNLGFIRVGGSAQGGIYQDSLVVGTGGGYPIKIAPQGSVAATFDTSGNLGLGVTSSAWSIGKAVEVGNLGSAIWSYGPTFFTTNYYYNSVDKFAGTGYALTYVQSKSGGSHSWNISTASGSAGGTATMTQAMTLDASGNLGIGTSSPTSFGGGYKTLEVKGSTSTNGGVVRASTSDNSYMIDMYANNAGGNLESRGANPMLFLTNSAERMRLDSSGNLGLGVTPSGWGTAGSTKVLQISTQTAVGEVYSASFLSANWYWNGTNDKYINNGYATRYAQASDTGVHRWEIAGNGTAGNNITFTQAMTLDASGNLALGTTSALLTAPSRTSLTVNGSSTAILPIATGGTTQGFLYTDATEFRLSAYQNIPLRFDTNNTERMRIDTSGNVLIGGTTSAARLYVVGANTSSGTLGLRVQDSATSDLFFIRNNGDGYLSGSLGIGTSSPGYKLDIYGASLPEMRIHDATVTFQAYTDGSSAAVLGTVGSHALVMRTNALERMRIDSSGNVLINSTTNSESAKFLVAGAKVYSSNIPTGQMGAYDSTTMGTGVGGAINFIGNYTSGGSATSFASVEGYKENATSGNYAGALVFRTRTNGGSQDERGRFSSTGGFSVGTTADPGAGAIYATGNITAYYSDERLKTKVGNIENALEKVKQIETMVYHANDTAVELGYDASVIEVGVTAQSVQKVQPEVVVPAPIDQQYLTVRYDRLVPLLIEAIKELEAKVEALGAK